MEHPNTPENAPKDPFGRMTPDDGSQDRFRDMPDITLLESAVGPSDDNRPDDVAKVEIMLDQSGLLNLRETDGPTGFYGERLRQAISALQRKLGLTENGRIAPGDPAHMALQKNVEKTRQKTPDGDQTPPSPMMD